MRIILKILNKVTCSNGGTVILESAIALPVMIILLMGVVNIGMAVKQYLNISRATYEGIRYISSLRDNAPGCSGQQCTQQSSPVPVNLSNTKQKIYEILNKKGVTNPEVTVEVVTLSADDRNATDPDHNTYSYNELRATVEAPFNGLFPMFNFIKLKKTMVFSDLYKDNKTSYSF